MLTIYVGGSEVYDEENNQFLTINGEVVHLEHSLQSLSKWESKYGRPFLGPSKKTPEETIGYVESMIIDDFPPENFLRKLTEANVKEVTDYINKTQSATTFNDTSVATTANAKEIISSELIYCWMTLYSIPFECDTWHLSRLFALIRVCNLKSSKPQKVNPKAARAEREALNRARREQLKTKG